MNNALKKYCPVCHHNECEQSESREWKIADDLYHLEQCKKCNSIFTYPMPSDAVLATLYRTSFNYKWYKDHYATKLRDCRLRVKEYSHFLGQRVLDFGGGLGYFSCAVVETGRESVTYDPYTTKVIANESKWDTIVLLHALEHSNDLDRTMDQIKSLLAPEGRIIIAVPNQESLGYQKQGMSWVWAQPPLLHVFHFTAAGLSNLLSRHGFSNIQITYHDRWDANSYCDINNLEVTRRMDSAWGKASFSLYRMYIARRNSKYRFEGLRISTLNNVNTSNLLTELQITAVLTNNV